MGWRRMERKAQRQGQQHKKRTDCRFLCFCHKLTPHLSSHWYAVDFGDHAANCRAPVRGMIRAHCFSPGRIGTMILQIIYNIELKCALIIYIILQDIFSMRSIDQTCRPPALRRAGGSTQTTGTGAENAFWPVQALLFIHLLRCHSLPALKTGRS